MGYEKVAALLKKHNMTAYRLSKETGVPASTINEWKKGKYTPKVDKLMKIADYFGVSITEFLDTKGA